MLSAFFRIKYGNRVQSQSSKIGRILEMYKYISVMDVHEDGRELVANDNKMILGFIMDSISPDVDVMNKVWEKSPKFCTICFVSKSHYPFSMML